MSQPSWIGYELNGRYKLEESLGQGGMSAVYKANDPNLKRIVAIKLIHPHLSQDPEFVRRFEVEAASVAQLRHPNIIQVYDFNHDGDTYYMVLEFVPGESLQERLARMAGSNRKLTPNEVGDLGAKVSDAVAYAHKRGLVHRDIKPANVMINVQGEPILMDFGIVKIVGEKHHTATGAVVGTALYMSPEQIRGERPDHRADIYSLGVMLYEMVSGKPPYQADSAMSVMMMHLNDPVPDLTQIAPETPASLKAVIEKSLQKNPDDRYQSANDLAADLRKFMASPSVIPAGTMIETPAPAAPAGTMVESPAGTMVEDAGATVAETPTVESAKTYVEPVAAAAAVAAPVAARPAAQRPAGPTSSDGKGGGIPKKTLLIGGGIAVGVLFLCAIIGFVVYPRIVSGTTGSPTEIPTELSVVGDAETATPTLVPLTDTPAPTPTETLVPTITPTPTATTPVGPYVLITDIQIEGSYYSISYEYFNYTPRISSASGEMHIHFFWNTYDPITAGTNGIGDSTGGGSWKLHDVPSPYVNFTLSSKPAGATQICALVANNDHSINLDSGNCFDLPE